LAAYLAATTAVFSRKVSCSSNTLGAKKLAGFYLIFSIQFDNLALRQMKPTQARHMHMGLQQRLLLFTFVLGTIGLFTSSSQAAKNEKQQRVLVIAIDGHRPDGVVRYAPNLHEFGQRHLAAWRSKVAIPISAPSWSSIFTGLSHHHTGIMNNAFTGKTLSQTDNQLVTGKKKTLFTHLREQGVSYAVVSTGTWDGIQKIANYGNSGNPKDKWIKAANNRTQTEYAAQVKGVEVIMDYITSIDIRMLTFYTHHVDNAGHIYGHDPDVLQYADAILQTDKNMLKIIKLIETREKKHNEDWMVLVTTDHGDSSRW
jgi:2,3-bisphosphoglycerate-independent phosphoglycerate mutase